MALISFLFLLIIFGVYFSIFFVLTTFFSFYLIVLIVFVLLLWFCSRILLKDCILFETVIGCFPGLLAVCFIDGDTIFFFWLFYSLLIYFEGRIRLLLELLRLLIFFMEDLSRSIFSLNVSTKVDFLNIPSVEDGIVLLVIDKL